MGNVVTPEEYVAVMTLYSKRNLASDCSLTSNLDESDEIFGSCFTDDIIFAVGGKVYWKNRDSLVASYRADRVEGQPRQHRMSNVYLEKLDDGTIQGRAQLLLIEIVDGEPQVRAVGHYLDKIRFDHDSWRFAQRSFTPSFSNVSLHAPPAE